MRWDRKKWVRMEESGRADDESRPILEKVDLMEAFFAGVHVKSKNRVFKSCDGGGGRGHVFSVFSFGR